MSKIMNTARKLQTAINQQSGAKIMINTTQWFSEIAGRAITCYIVKQSTTADGDEKRYRRNVELFSTYSQVQLVLWLRDYYYELNGWEVPTDNELWEKVKHGRQTEAGDAIRIDGTS